MMTPLKKFFLPPCEREQLPQELKDSGERPVLHLIRRDLEKLYDSEAVYQTSDPIKHGPPILASSGILTGLDLMSRFFIGDFRRTVKRKRVTDAARFKRFLVEIGGVRRPRARFLWAFRCAIAHSYGLVLRGRGFTKAQIVLTTGAQQRDWLTEDKLSAPGKYRRRYTVNLWLLKKLFHGVIEKAELALTDERRKHIRKRFHSHYKTHGATFVLQEAKSANAFPGA